MNSSSNVIDYAIKLDDHVHLGGIIANPLHKAATAYGGTFKSVQRDRTAIFDGYRLSSCGAGKRSAKVGH